MRTLRTRAYLALIPFHILLASAAQGDGIALKGLDWTSLRPAVENEQIAAIHLRDGVQRMIIAINFDAEEDEHGLWMFPAPGNPDEIAVTIQDQFPALNGRDPRSEASRRISATMTALRAWELLPVLFEICLLSQHLGVDNLGGVAIHSEVEQWGVRAEVLSATSVEALEEHLRAADLDIAGAQLQTLAPYTDGEHAIVTVWITSRAEVKAKFPQSVRHKSPGSERTPCLYVEFPTDRAFFPLKPTSLYGDVSIPLRLHVIGFVKPETEARNVGDGLHVGHYQGAIRNEFADFGRWAEGLPDDAIPYTTVFGSFRADEFTDDLWFVPVDPSGMAFGRLMTSRLGSGLLILSFIVLLVGLSYVSGGITGLLVGEGWSIPAKLGCWNVLTWVGLRFALRHHDLAGGPGGTEPKLRRNFSYAFLMVYVALTIFFQVAMVAPLLLRD